MTAPELTSRSSIIGMLDDDATMAGADLMPDTELAEAALTDTPLAYSEPTGSITVTDYEPPSSTRWWPVAALVAVILAVTGGAAGVILWLGHRSPAAVPTTTSAVSDVPTDPADQGFIDSMHEFNIPVPDWRYTVVQGQSLCRAFEELDAAPGEHTVGQANDATREQHPDWNDAQVTFFVAGAFNSYCPQMWGPTDEELAAMPPDERFLALIGKRAGLSAGDDGSSVISGAHAICGQLAYGATRKSAASQLLASNQGDLWNPDVAMSFVNSAVDVYCPQR